MKINYKNFLYLISTYFKERENRERVDIREARLERVHKLPNPGQKQSERKGMTFVLIWAATLAPTMPKKNRLKFLLPKGEGIREKCGKGMPNC